MTNSKLFIPVGMPGCGKSTMAKRVLGVHTVSSDQIREEIHPGLQHDASRNDEVFALYHERIEDWLRGGDVYADATNLQSFARQTLRQIAARAGAETHVLFFTNVQQAVKRNTQRTAVVPPEAMLKFIHQLETAHRAIPMESYDSVTQIAGVS